MSFRVTKSVLVCISRHERTSYIPNQETSKIPHRYQQATNIQLSAFEASNCLAYPQKITPARNSHQGSTAFDRPELHEQSTAHEGKLVLSEQPSALVLGTRIFGFIARVFASN
jgi:hypothetical protein